MKTNKQTTTKPNKRGAFRNQVDAAYKASMAKRGIKVGRGTSWKRTNNHLFESAGNFEEDVVDV